MEWIGSDTCQAEIHVGPGRGPLKLVLEDFTVVCGCMNRFELALG